MLFRCSHFQAYNNWFVKDIQLTETTRCEAIEMLLKVCGMLLCNGLIMLCSAVCRLHIVFHAREGEWSRYVACIV